MIAPCHVCGQDALAICPEFSKLSRVTSDCKPWPAGGKLGVCTSCGVVASRTDEDWRREADEIYQQYTIYHQGAGAEQSVFDQATGQVSARSARMVGRLKEEVGLPREGRLLDMGCGNGAFLGAFASCFPNWSLAGSEFDGKYQAQVEAIPSVEKLHTEGLDSIPGKFDVVSLVHVLEHIESPRIFLEQIRSKLRPTGRLFIELPYYADNPFELLIADHATHFDPVTIQHLLAASGFSPLLIRTDWVAKELSVVAAPGGGASPHAENPLANLSNYTQWLSSVADSARSIMEGAESFGIFGTSIGATWLLAELGDGVAFFVDEDPNRVGRFHADRPIHHPSTVPADSDIFVALPPSLCGTVVTRLSRGLARYHGVPSQSC